MQVASHTESLVLDVSTQVFALSSPVAAEPRLIVAETSLHAARRTRCVMHHCPCLTVLSNSNLSDFVQRSSLGSAIPAAAKPLMSLIRNIGLMYCRRTLQPQPNSSTYADASNGVSQKACSQQAVAKSPSEVGPEAAMRQSQAGIALQQKPHRRRVAGRQTGPTYAVRNASATHCCACCQTMQTVLLVSAMARNSCA